MRVGDRRAVLAHLVQHGSRVKRCREPADLAVERRREQHRLPVGAEHLEDPRARRAGTPCRACGRPRRARRCARGRAGAACAARGRAGGLGSRSGCRRAGRAWPAVRCRRRRRPRRPCSCATSAIARNSSVTWLASSRVGARISADGLRPLGSAARRSAPRTRASCPTRSASARGRRDRRSRRRITRRLDLERSFDPAHPQGSFGPGGHAEFGEGPGVRGQHGAALGWVLMHHYLDFLCRWSAARREPAEPHRNEACERVGISETPSRVASSFEARVGEPSHCTRWNGLVHGRP